MKNPDLHIFLGAGGVGKTTLSASYAMALAKSGKKVALLSIDPARRLQSALGVKAITDEGVKLPLDKNFSGSVIAALLDPGVCLRRWVREQGLKPEAEASLYNHPLFKAVADKFASATDTIAAMRLAEWKEKHPEIDAFVVDTAPGIHAVDFLARPEKLISFLDGKLVEWLKWLIGSEEGSGSRLLRPLKAGARKILDGLATVGGKGFLLNFAQFVVLSDQVFSAMLRRLEDASLWLRQPSTAVYLVTAVREDAALVALELSKTLQQHDFENQISIINRASPYALFTNEKLRRLVGEGSLAEDARTQFLSFVRAQLELQNKVRQELSTMSHQCIELPIQMNLDQAEVVRLSDLVSLGEKLLGNRNR